MNKSSNENAPNPFVQAHKISLGVFMKILIFLEVKRSFIKGGREVGQLCADVEYA